MKLLSKHKLFIWLLFSLALLAIGSFFAFGNDKKDSDACTLKYTLSIGLLWDKPNHAGENQGSGMGSWKSYDGNTYSGAMATMTATITQVSGFSWDSSSTMTCTTETGEYVRKAFTIKNDKLSESNASNFSLSASTSVSLSPGFTYRGTGLTNSITVSGKIWRKKVIVNGTSYDVGRNDTKELGYTDWLHITPCLYTVTFDANGGTHSTTTTTKNIYYYNNYQIIDKEPTRTGYTFDGWYTGKTDGTQVTADTCYNTAGNTTLYAHWTANTYEVTLDRNIASGTSDITGGRYAMGTTSLTATYDDTYPDITVPVRNGYTFNGYYTSATGGDQVYNSEGKSSLTYTTADNQTLYAHWTANTISITLDQQLGANGTTAFKYTYDTNAYYHTDGKALSLTLPTRTGYTFGGYYTDISGGGTQYITPIGNIANSLFKNVYDDITLYANWTENSYTIAFNANGGSGSMISITGVLYTASKTLRTNEFYRYGYLFKGWAKTAVAVDADITYYDLQSVSKLTPTNGATVTLYAVWEKTWAVDKQTPSGAGTESNPYLISTPQHLGWMAYQTETQNLSGYFKQTANISLAGETYLPIGKASTKAFIGNYDGNNYVITNLTTTETREKSNTGNFKYSYQGLFGYTNNATIDNVKLLSGTIKGYNRIGGIVGEFGASTITNSQVGSVSIYANGYSNGGIVGYGYSSTLQGCYSKSQMSGGSHYAGILGDSNCCTLTACAFEGTLDSITFGYQMGYSSYNIASKNNVFIDCFAKTTTANKFYGGPFIKDSCLYIAGTNKKYYSGNFTNWVIVKSSSEDKNPLILPQGLSWLAIGGTKVTSVNEIIALGYTAA